MPAREQASGLDSAGLSLEEVTRRRQAYGPNRLPRTRRVPWWRLLAAQMGQFFALMLWVAGLLSVLAGTLQQGLAIFGIIVLNGTFAFLQEYRAELAGERLQALLPLQAIVVRAGRRQMIAAEELVPGDLVLLAAGDRIAADLRWRQAQELTLNMAALTGESVPVPAVEQQAGFAGTFVLEGEGSGEVTAIGGATELARLARLAAGEKRPPSWLARELRRLVKIIASWSLGLGLGFWALALLVGIPARDGFLFAVGVTVAMVPEGLRLKRSARPPSSAPTRRAH